MTWVFPSLLPIRSSSSLWLVLVKSSLSSTSESSSDSSMEDESSSSSSSSPPPLPPLLLRNELFCFFFLSSKYQSIPFKNIWIIVRKQNFNQIQGKIISTLRAKEYNSCVVQNLTYISINDPNIIQFHLKTSELL